MQFTYQVMHYAAYELAAVVGGAACCLLVACLLLLPTFGLHHRQRHPDTLDWVGMFAPNPVATAAVATASDAVTCCAAAARAIGQHASYLAAIGPGPQLPVQHALSHIAPPFPNAICSCRQHGSAVG